MSSSTSTPALFRPTQVGEIELSHRVVLAPQTRFRANKEQVPGDLVLDYYKQRGSVPGTLLITEATCISAHTFLENAPGIYTDEQISGWKKTTEAVHAQGSYIFVQLAGAGRMARRKIFNPRDDAPYVAPSPIPIPESGEKVPKEMTKEEIKQYVDWFATSAANAVHRAGFDGVEIHGANGYLLNQFLEDTINKRTDEYGGSIENRARFMLEVVDAIVARVGQSKTGLRLSPWDKGPFGDMRMDDPVPTYTYLVDQLKQKYPNLAYLHVVSPIAPFNAPPENATQSDFIYRIWSPRPIITTGGYDRESGLKVAAETGQLVGYGRAFLANPDLPFRLEKDIALNQVDPTTIYARESPDGYTTYPFCEEFLKSRQA
ncbi:hypothetical protein GSI_11655 [Ganoderma sinense ZZ0214-1]|uniref:NADH:flavin oxidoreductase/NADH oxidase N-terminal domain-containing protein n=1 Tax=Ganoderma sinense ZZ0214-1 TaxID=1077348 RepID=A0A2G8RWL3_9APHY|nr:hypothetical protein GSI_11655 [Ganoderma sinense ZZ0214-1]